VLVTPSMTLHLMIFRCGMCAMTRMNLAQPTKQGTRASLSLNGNKLTVWSYK
jgi:hypothetical protein